MLHLLHKAADFSFKRQDERSFFVGAMGFRADGAIVFARNSPAEIPTPSAHAEARLVKKLGKNAPLVLVARYSVGRQGLAMAKPCPACEAILKSYKVKQVIYSTGIDAFESYLLK